SPRWSTATPRAGSRRPPHRLAKNPSPAPRERVASRECGEPGEGSAAYPLTLSSPPPGGEGLERSPTMSVQGRSQRLTVTQIRSRKGGDKIVCLTAYTAPLARLLDPEVDLLLVGDSLAMTIYGFDSTLPVTLDMMIAHGAAVVRSTQHALITVDLPFGSYH